MLLLDGGRGFFAWGGGAESGWARQESRQAVPQEYWDAIWQRAPPLRHPTVLDSVDNEMLVKCLQRVLVDSRDECVEEHLSGSVAQRGDAVDEQRRRAGWSHVRRQSDELAWSVS